MTEYAFPSTFKDQKLCSDCRRALPQSYTDDICPACKERALFSEVKDYIRANDVNEFDVANHFSIPLHKVKGWIREGRIEYKELSSPTIESMHCQKCGTPIRFGTLCPKCQRKSNTSGNATFSLGDEIDRFHYLSKNNDTEI